jgi:hypothetical protein
VEAISRPDNASRRQPATGHVTESERVLSSRFGGIGRRPEDSAPHRAARRSLNAGAGGCVVMIALPRPSLLLLHEAAAFVVERCDCDPAEARTALLRAFREGTIPTRGRAAVSWPGRPEGMPQSLYVADIDADDWYTGIDWECDCLGGYQSVTVERCNVERWLSDQPSDSEALALPPGGGTAIAISAPAGAEAAQKVSAASPEPSDAPAVRRKIARNDYRVSDRPLVEEMHRLIRDRDATGQTDAARALWKRAEGRGNEASKVRRLSSFYTEIYGETCAHVDTSA